MRDMGSEERQEAIDQLDLSFVRERIAATENLEGHDVEKVEMEFKKFMKLVLCTDGPLAVIDKRVDELWHAFILFTPQYQRFCEDTMGFFVHHQPRTSTTPVPICAISNFVRMYREKYGEVDPFWFELLEPEVEACIRSGRVPESLGFKWSGWTGRDGVLDAPSEGDSVGTSG